MANDGAGYQRTTKSAWDCICCTEVPAEGIAGVCILCTWIEIWCRDVKAFGFIPRTLPARSSCTHRTLSIPTVSICHGRDKQENGSSTKSKPVHDHRSEARR